MIRHAVYRYIRMVMDKLIKCKDCVHRNSDINCRHQVKAYGLRCGRTYDDVAKNVVLR